MSTEINEDDKQSKTVSDWLKREAAPDVLDTIANLSNDEVFTSPGVANQMLDLLPAEVWSNPDLKFLDPCCKTGVFLREITKRLMAGLADVIPDVTERREHILRNQVYGIAITELTALMSRRTLYCSSDATREMDPENPENCFSAVLMDTPEGNIAFPKAEHDYDPKGKCRICGAKKEDLGSEAREGRETYAYPFIHMDTLEIFDMQFDVIIGNPPYQLKDGGHSASASPIYHLFVESAKKIGPKYLSMIIPARWYAGGKGLNEFRESMINDRRIRSITDFPKLFDCFPGVEIKGGVCFFLWSRDEEGDCLFKTSISNEIIAEMQRDLREGVDVLIREGRALTIYRKVVSKSENFVSDLVSARKPFGFGTNIMGNLQPDKPDDAIFIRRKGRGFMPRSEISTNRDWIDRWKVLTPMAGDGHGRIPAIVTGAPIVSKPGEICSETYLVVGPLESEKQANNLSAYMRSKFVRLMISLRKNTQHLTRDRFGFVPLLDFSELWDDEKLYSYFNLTQDEVDFIESQIKEMP